MHKTLTESANEAGVTTARVRTNRSAKHPTESEPNSTLIEFPGSRSVPEWRKRLSQRVRELQEQKAREAAEAAAEMRAAETVSCALPSGQLELVPEREQAPLNPIVSKALKRVERARRTEGHSTGYSTAATAPSLAPAEPERAEPIVEPDESKPKLTIVTATVIDAPQVAASIEKDETGENFPESELADKPRRVGVITTSLEDSTLAYVESCLSLPAHLGEVRKDAATLTRRAIVGVLDLFLIALMVLPVALAINAEPTNWSNPRIVGLLCGITAATMFAYLTISIALTGRTLSMRLLSVRTIDERTGQILWTQEWPADVVQPPVVALQHDGVHGIDEIARFQQIGFAGTWRPAALGNAMHFSLLGIITLTHSSQRGEFGDQQRALPADSGKHQAVGFHAAASASLIASVGQTWAQTVQAVHSLAAMTG